LIKINSVDLKPEIPYIGEVPLVPNVRPVIVVAGSDYEMGYQHYQQIIEVFGPLYIKRLIKKKYTEEQLDAHKAYEVQIKKYTPELIDYMKGMAAGASDVGVPLSYNDVISHLTGNNVFSDTTGSKNENPPEEHDCSGFAAWGSTTKDGKLVCGGSGDHDLSNFGRNFRPEYVIIHFPETGNNYICSPPSGGACHPGMNNKGVAYVHHGCTGYLETYKVPEERFGQYGVPRLLGYLHVLRFANSAKEALDMLLSIPNDTGNLGGIWADVNGTAFDIENRDNPRCVRKPGDHGEVDFLYSTNTLLCEELGELMKHPPEGGKVQEYVRQWPGEKEYITHGGWLARDKDISAVSRNLNLRNLFTHYHGEVDFEFARMMWRFPAEQPSYLTLEEAESANTRTKGEGWHAKICSAKNSMVGILLPDNGDEGLFYVSQGCAARITAPLNPGGHFYRIAPTYSFFQLKLDSSLDKVVEAARIRAQYDQYYANLELRKLNYHDYAYAPLDEIFNESAVEWNRGEYYLNTAKESNGNEAVRRYGKAIRAYTRCQALAKQVYNSLVPPPDSPEDLGLRPWKYWDRK
jgi:hypothetical protein